MCHISTPSSLRSNLRPGVRDLALSIATRAFSASRCADHPAGNDRLSIDCGISRAIERLQAKAAEGEKVH
jgi:hypothetical protein